MGVKCILHGQTQPSKITNLILKDEQTSEKYSLVIENGKLNLLAVSNSAQEVPYSIIDTQTGITYSLIIENGKLILQEV